MLLPAHVPIGLYSSAPPLGAIIGAAVLVVAASFALIYLAAPAVRPESSEAGVPVPRPIVWAMTGLGILYLGFVVVVATFGRQELAAVNGASLLFWIYTIPFLPLAHCLVGGMYEVANPFAFVARKLSGGRHLGNAGDIIARLGYWPALAMMFLLVFAESISDIVQRPAVLGIGAVVYAAVQVVMGVLLGDGWYRGGDVFHAITSLASTLAPCGMRRDSQGVVRFLVGFNPARFLPSGPGRQALITLWLAGVLADGVRATPIWRVLILPHTQAAFEQMGSLAGVDLGSASEITLEIVSTWIAFAVFFWVFVLVASVLSASTDTPLDRASLHRAAVIVSPSLIPIALAYLFAHNLTQILAIGPLIVTARDAPVSQLGLLVSQQVRHISPGTVWWLQVGAIVLGHVLAVTMAHARLTQAMRPGAEIEVAPAATRARRSRPAAAAPAAEIALPQRRIYDRAFRADLGWLSAMLIYTATSLWILAQPILPA